MPLTREQFTELLHQGLTPEQIATFEAGAKPPGSDLAMLPSHAPTGPPMEPPSPTATAREMTRSAAGQTIEQLAGLAPYVAGGLTASFGGGPLAAYGAGAGAKALTNLAFKRPPGTGVREAGRTQFLLSTPELVLGKLAEGATAAGRMLKARGVRQAAERAGAIAESRDITGPLKVARDQARVARSQSSSALVKELEAGTAQGHEVTIKNIVDEIAASQQRAMRSRTPIRPEDYNALRARVRAAIKELAAEHTMGAFRGGRTVFTLEEADKLASMFGTRAEKAFKLAKEGVKTNPEGDQLMVTAIRNVIKRKVPSSVPLYRDLSRAIESEKGIARLQKGQIAESAQPLVKEQAVRVARAAAANPAPGAGFNLASIVRREPPTSTGVLQRMLELGGQAAGSAPALETARQFPRGAITLFDLYQALHPQATTFEPDTLTGGLR